MLIIAFPNAIANLYACYIERNLGVDISFSSSEIVLLKEWHFNDVEISSKKGYALSIKGVAIYPPFLSLRKRELNANCKAKNIKFRKGLPLLDSISMLLSTKSLADVAIESIEVNIALKHKRLQMNNLKALSKDVKVFGEGEVDINKSLMDYKLKFLFSKDITDNLHNTIKTSLLKQEDPYWMSLNIRANGDYKKPSLSLDSDFFKLNIREIEMK